MSTSAVMTLTADNLAILALCFLALWAVSVRVRDASIVDIFWGPACAIPAILTFFRADGASPRDAVLTALVVLWAARLSIHLAARNLGHGEDFRYARMRAAHPSDASFARWSLFYVFGLQCLIAWFVSAPVQLGQLGGAGAPGPAAWTGILIFFVGFAFEAVGDWQLRKFKSVPENKGRLMTTGLWAWTRHPNYFGDSLVWVGLALIALEGPYGYLGVASPIVMGYFLVNVSGKSLLERGMMKKYPEYESYRARVSGFLPRPPRSPTQAPSRSE